MSLDQIADTATPASRPLLRPISSGDRLFNLDMLRGVAVLGILTVNVLGYAWPFEVVMSEQARPFAMIGPDRLGYWITDVFFEDKFRTLFTMLFGVSIFLVGGERSDKARGKLLRRRLFWLGVFGLVHGLLFWFGDILFGYAYAGLIMMLMRSWSARRLLWIGGGFTALFCLIATGFPLLAALGGAEFHRQMQAAGPSATPADVMASVDLVRSGYVPAMIQNLKVWALGQLVVNQIMLGVAVSLMMLGLGLFKSGFLTGRAPMWVYALLVFAAGINLAVFGHFSWIDTGAGPGANPTRNLDAASAGLAPLVTLGYASALILLVRLGLRPVVAAFAPVGRMAFTNYLTQTLMMTSLFYMPWGPHLYGTMGPGALWMVIGCVWATQLIWSPLWLSRFEMGPLEWVWRRLTYGGNVPFRRIASGNQP